MQKKILLFITILFNILAFGQIQEVSPTSPNTASLGKFSIFPTVTQTGTPDISIPLYTLEEKGFQIPIALKYHASGIKVEQFASWVGMGFALSANAFITRSVMDLPDDYNSNELVLDPGPVTYATKGWFQTMLTHKTASQEIQDFPRPLDYYYAGNIEAEPFVHLQSLSGKIGLSSGATQDSQPDVFIINLFGRTVKFVFDSQGIPRFIDENDLKITYSTNDNLNIIQFKITDEAGVVYILDEKETTTITRTYKISNVSNTFPSVRTYTSAWYVSKIILPTNNTIQFTYDQENTTYKTNLFETASKATGNSVGEIKTPPNLDKVDVSSIGKLLKTIKTTNATAYFTLSNASRLDLAGGRSLQNIKISRNSDQQTIKRFTFNYLYRSSSNFCMNARNLCYSECPANLDECYQECDYTFSACTNNSSESGNISDPNNYRLFLKSVQESEMDNDKCYCESVRNDCYSKCPNIDECFQECDYSYISCKTAENQIVDCNGVTLKKKPPYEFSYDETILPPRLSKQQDFWGYYNANGSSTLIPSLNIYPSYTDIRNKYSYIKRENYLGNAYSLNGANRMAREIFTKAGILTKIQYPTKGSTVYEYQSNEYYEPDHSKNFKGGGLRIKKITLYDGKDHNNDIIKNYTYNKYSNPSLSSGVLVNFPSYTKPVGAITNGNDYSTWITYQDRVNQGWTEGQLNTYFVERVSDYFSPLSNLDGVQVSYTDVAETINGAKTVFQYYKPKNYLDNASLVQGSRLPTSIPKQSCRAEDAFPEQKMDNKSGVQGFGDGWVVSNPCGADGGPSNIVYGNIQPSGTNVYPFPPLSDNEFYHNSKLYNKIEFNSSNSIVRETSYEYTNLLRNNSSYPVYGIAKGVQAVGWARTGTFASTAISWSKYKYNTGVASAIKKITEKTYKSTTNYVVSEKEYEYNGNSNVPYLMIRRINSTKSNGTKDVNQYTYAPDLVGILPNMQDLKTSNRIEEPIQIKNILKNSSTEQIISFKQTDYGVFGNLILPQKTQNAKDGNALEDEFYYDNYDDLGNIIQFHKKNGTPTSIIWGYNKTQPIAKIENASYSQVTPYVSNLQNHSNTGSEANLILALNALRASLPDAMITTYTYIPLVGVSTITDQKGYSTTYTYDSFGRLEFVKDNKGNILSENQYNYKQ